MLLLLACTSPADDASGHAKHDAEDKAPPAPIVDASTLHGKLMMGYQGWFACPDDGAGRGWVHWSPGVQPAADNVSFDAWPDLSEFGDDELCETAFTYADGTTAGLYSAHNPKSVARHGAWMRTYGLDGVFLQRFTLELPDPTAKANRDRVAQNVRAAAESYGRVFAMEYDISGNDPATVADDIIEDWKHLVDDLGLTESDRYLRHDGRPVLAVWGFGYTDRPGTPADALRVIDFFHNPPDERYGATLVGGVPGEWRSLTGDSRPEADWGTVYRSWDIINPWTVGRYADEAGADSYRRNYLDPDRQAAIAAGAEYMPVIWPGFSWTNLFDGKYPLNQIPRNGGRFYWRQAYNAIAAGNTMIFNAMFDEVDEGTAMMKVASNRSALPTSGTFLSLDADGERLPSDWYLRVGGAATAMLHGEIALTRTLPISPEDAPPPEDTGGVEVDGWNEVTVDRAYRGILGREPDAGGASGWVAALDGGMSVSDLARHFWTSDEFAANRAHLDATTLATDLYTGILSREPDPGGLGATVDAIAAGRGAERAADMLTSEEAGEGW